MVTAAAEAAGLRVRELLALAVAGGQRADEGGLGPLG